LIRRANGFGLDHSVRLTEGRRQGVRVSVEESKIEQEEKAKRKTNQDKGHSRDWAGEVVPSADKGASRASDAYLAVPYSDLSHRHRRARGAIAA